MNSVPVSRTLSPSNIAEAADLLAAKIRKKAADSQGLFICAIDGRSASGKTSLARAVSARLPDCAVIHLDDFFLQPEQRSVARLKTPGQNVDHERLRKEVLIPLREGRSAIVRPYGCRNQTFLQGYVLNVPKILLLEGSYSLNDELLPFSSYRVFVSCSPAVQRVRLLERSGAERLEQFILRWIPLEEFYFRSLQVEDRADLILDLDCPSA